MVKYGSVSEAVAKGFSHFLNSFMVKFKNIAQYLEESFSHFLNSFMVKSPQQFLDQK